MYIYMCIYKMMMYANVMFTSGRYMYVPHWCLCVCVYVWVCLLVCCSYT